MFTLRCTQRLATRLKLPVAELKRSPRVTPTTALGDWYAHLVYIDRQQLILLVSEPTRLCLVTTAKDPQRLPERLSAMLGWLMAELDVPQGAIDKELVEMREFCYGTTDYAAGGRGVVASINQYTQHLRFRPVTLMTPEGLTVDLLEWISRSIDDRRPLEASFERLWEAFERDGGQA